MTSMSPCIVLLLSATLVACGGGAAPVPPPALATPELPGLPLPSTRPVPTPAVDGAPPSTPESPDAVASSALFFVAGSDEPVGDAPADRDGDGLPDAVDPFPDTTAEQDHVDRRLALLAVYSRGPDWIAHGKAHAELPLTLRLTGQAVGEAVYAVLWSAEGPRVEPLAVHGEQAQLPASALAAPVQRISLTTARWQSAAMAVDWYAPGEPLLADPAPAVAGDTLTLHGLHLDVVRSLQLGNQPLSLLQQGADVLQVALPATARSGELAAAGLAGVLDRVGVPVLRRIHLDVAPALRAGVPLLQWQEGEQLLGGPSEAPFSRLIPAEAGPVLVSFERRPGSLLPTQVLVGPAETQVTVDAARLLEGLAAPAWAQAWPAGARQADAGRVRLRETLASPEGQALATALAEALVNGDTDPFVPRLPALRALARQADPTPEVTAEAKVGLRVRDLAAGQFRVRRGSIVDNRNELSNFSVVNTDPSLGLAERCQGLLAGGAPAGFAAFDLCLENDNVVSASVAVTLEGQSRAARSHIDPRQGLFNPNIAGGNTLGVLFRSQNTFLTSDSMQPLCGQSPCRIDVLTGGAGVGLRETLSPREFEVAELLQRRALLDLVLLPLISNTVGLGGTLTNQRCLATGTDKLISSGVLVKDFVAKLEAAAPLDGDKISALAQDVLRQPLVDLLLNLESVIADCGFAALPTVTAVKNRIQDTIERRLSTASRFAGAITAAVQLGVTGVEFATTPRKITFEYEPLARVTSVTENFDVSRPDPGPLVIRGRQLAETDPEAPSQFLPTLVFTGPRKSNGAPRIETLAVEPGWVSPDAGGGDFTALRRISVPSPILAFRLQSDFRVGRIGVRLRYNHPDLAEFPGGVIEIPGGFFNFLTAPEVHRAGPAIATVGDSLIVSGYRLDQLERPLALKQVAVNFSPLEDGNDLPEVLVVDGLRLVRRNSGADDERTLLHVQLPDIESAGFQRYQVSLSSPQINAELGIVTVTAPGVLGSVEVTDVGSCKDDIAGIDLISDAIPGVESVLGSFDTSAQSGFRGQVLWNNGALPLPVDTLRVRCRSAGDDCVARARAGRQDPAGICTLAVTVMPPGAPARRTVKLNLAEGDSELFDVRP